METIRLLVSVSAAVAVRAGTVRAGESAVPLTPEHLQALTESEREQLSVLLDRPNITTHPGAHGLRKRTPHGFHAPGSLSLPSPDTSPEAVVGALRAYLTQERTAYEAMLAEERASLEKDLRRFAENRIRETIGAPPGARWYVPGEYVPNIVKAIGLAIPGAVEAGEVLRCSKEEVVARNAADLAAEAKRYCALAVERRMRRDKNGEWEAMLPLGIDRAQDIRARLGAEAAAAFDEAGVAADAKNLQEGKERAEAKRLAHEAVVAFALTVPDLAPAAREAYDVRKGVADEIARRVAAVPAVPVVPGIRNTKLVDAEVYAFGGRGWEPLEWEEASSPSARILALRDRIVEHVATVAHPEGVTITVSRASRVTTEARDDNHSGYDEAATRKRRGIVAMIDGAGLPQRIVVFPAE